MKPRDLALYCLLALIWGFSFLFLVKSVAVFGWAGTSAFRSIIAGVTVAAFAILQRRKLNFGGQWKPLLIVAATTVAGQYVGIALAAPKIGTAMSAIFISTVPLFAMVISRLAGMEHLAPARIAGLLLGIFGIALLVGFPTFAITPDFLLGVAMCLASCVSAAVGSVYASHHLTRSDPWAVTSGAFFLGGLMVLPFLWVAPMTQVPVPMDYLWLVLLGVLISGAGYVLYFGLVSSIGPTRAVSVEFAVTVIAVIVGGVFLGERLSAIQWIGAATVIFGCTLVLGLIPLGRRGVASSL
ncbi:DMT family transporter [Aestuariivirga litoralis]|uniref:DMT family transporter n=1 Tax=Aestuariivirga litoralis TaxID=2650924 RepID=UPI0018C524E4|nr:DMT family transporter [Aestuariivirga litoralis]MBG1231343.1 EamA family transporter [Aestuariivirga litoralis]